MSNQLFSFLGWSFIPSVASSFVQTCLYSLTYPAGSAPQQSTLKYHIDRRRIQITLISLYLLFTLFETLYDIRMQGDYYQLLSVPHDVAVPALRSRFRKLAARFHPDKAGGYSEAQYAVLRHANDVIADPVRRFAYDRFGPDAVVFDLKDKASVSMYALGAVVATVRGYLGMGVVLVGLGWLGYAEFGRFWRYFALSTMLILEIYVSSRPYAPPFLTQFLNPVLKTIGFPPLLPFQFLVFARKSLLTTFIAISQVGPLISSSFTSGARNGNEVSAQQLSTLGMMVEHADKIGERLVQLNLAPYKGDEGSTKKLRERMSEWIVDAATKSDGEVKRVVDEVLLEKSIVVGGN